MRISIKTVLFAALLVAVSAGPTVAETSRSHAGHNAVSVAPTATSTPPPTSDGQPAQATPNKPAMNCPMMKDDKTDQKAMSDGQMMQGDQMKSGGSMMETPQSGQAGMNCPMVEKPGSKARAHPRHKMILHHDASPSVK